MINIGCGDYLKIKRNLDGPLGLFLEKIMNTRTIFEGFFEGKYQRISIVPAPAQCADKNLASEKTRGENSRI